MTTVLPILIITILLHSLAMGVVWVVLQGVTKKCSFSDGGSLNNSGNRFPWPLSLLLTVALILAFLIPGYPNPDVRNYGFMLNKFLFLSCGSGLFSLGFWLRMSVKPDLRTLHLAIIGMLTAAVGFFFLIMIGSASPV
jgi:hypothetical protein